MAEMMRVYELRKFGLEDLTLAERPVPEPGPREALVRIRAVATNFRDVSIALGYYNARQKLPMIPLSDAVGEVVAVGAGTTRVKPGERVCPAFFQTAWISGTPDPRIGEATLGSPHDGTLCEYRVFHEDALVRPPAHLSDEEAATLPCAAVTAWRAMFDLAGLQPGQSVLLQGTGGVAVFGIQFARAAGLRAVVISSSDEKLVRARALGATDTVNYKTNPDWEQAVLQLTHGRGVDAILEIGGGNTFMKSVLAAGHGGTIVCIGFLAGLMSEVSVGHIMMKNLTIRGVTVGPRDAFEAMNRAIEQSGLRPEIHEVLAFEQAAGVLARMKSAEHFGKLVVRVA